MSSAYYSIEWTTIDKDISKGFYELLCRDELVDVTLVAEEQLIKAHRTLLAVCSSYFRKEFNMLPANQNAIVILKDVKYNVLENLIRFIYRGEVTMREDELPAFFSTAEKLCINALTPSSQNRPNVQTVLPGLPKPIELKDHGVSGKPQSTPGEQQRQHYQQLQAATLGQSTSMGIGIGMENMKITNETVAGQIAIQKPLLQQQKSLHNIDLSSKKLLNMNTIPHFTKDRCELVGGDQNPFAKTCVNKSYLATKSNPENAEVKGLLLHSFDLPSKKQLTVNSKPQFTKDRCELVSGDQDPFAEMRVNKNYLGTKSNPENAEEKKLTMWQLIRKMVLSTAHT